MLKLKALLPDALLLAGATSLSYGFWLVLPAAGFITAGVVAIAFGIMIARI